MTNTHSHGANGWHDHPIFDSTADHIAAHDATDKARVVKFFDGATWVDGIGISWPDTMATGWANSSEAQTDIKFEHRLDILKGV